MRIEELHTSGHATISELKDLANALDPKMIIPIHTFHPEKFQEHFSNVRVVNNEEELDIWYENLVAESFRSNPGAEFSLAKVYAV